MQNEPSNPIKKPHCKNLGLLLVQIFYEDRPWVTKVVNFFKDGGCEMSKTGWKFLFICCFISWGVLRFAEYEIKDFFISERVKDTLLPPWYGEYIDSPFNKDLEYLSVAKQHEQFEEALSNDIGGSGQLSYWGISAFNFGDYSASRELFDQAKNEEKNPVRMDCGWRANYP